MADYLGFYQNDIDDKLIYTQLSVFLYQDRLKESTSTEFDLDYLPSIYLENVDPFVKDFSCPVNLRKRLARFLLAGEQELRVELLFKPNTNNFNTFFEQSSVNNQILSIGLQGEKINSFYLKQKVKQ